MPEHGEPLSEREAELLQLVATGATNRQIAQRLQISVNTVKVHVRNILSKLGASSRTEATVIAVRQGLVVVEGAPAASAAGPDAAGELTDEEPPAPALPWPKRAALIVVPLLVALATALTARGGILPNQLQRDDLPPESPREERPVAEAAGTDSRWHARAQMPTPRAYLGLASVGGRLVAIGGRTQEGVSSAVEVYDPQGDIWTRGAEKPTATAYVSAVAIGSEVFVPGGCDADFRPSRTVEVFDSDSDEWRTAAPLPAPRCAYALAVHNGRVMVIGGWDGEGYVATVFALDVVEGVWTEAVPLREPRGFMAAATVDGVTYVVGGYDGRRELRACARLEPGRDDWQPCAPLTLGRGGLGLAAVGQKVFAMGGGGWESYLGFNERYEPGSDSWYPIETPLTGEWRSPGIAVIEHTVYAVGGWNNGYLSLNQAFDVLRFRIFIPVTETQ
jgi:DNA-binding CsgD family transcriptional regulator